MGRRPIPRDSEGAYRDARSMAKGDFLLCRIKTWCGKSEDGYLPTLRYASQGYSCYLESSPHRIGPLETQLIEGTISMSRRRDFSFSYMPLAPYNQGDFAAKWMGVFRKMRKGALHPVNVIEFMHRYFVEHGHKRTSVANYLGMPVIDARVTRLVPDTSNEDLQTKLYHDFLSFEKKTGMSYIWFSEEGSFDELTHIISQYATTLPKQRQVFENQVYEPFMHNFRKVWADSGDYTHGDVLLRYIKKVPEMDESNWAMRKRIKGILKGNE